jgi:hypothetical protein
MLLDYALRSWNKNVYIKATKFRMATVALHETLAVGFGGKTKFGRIFKAIVFILMNVGQADLMRNAF